MPSTLLQYDPDCILSQANLPPGESLSAIFGVVDLFAGPGGLGEGFASFRTGDHAPFEIRVSIEKEASAHRTLQLRAFLREHVARHGAYPQSFIDFHAGRTGTPDWRSDDPAAWQLALDEAHALELGTPEASAVVDDVIRKMPARFDDSVLIGGPPCQAYSVIGRVRARSDPDYVPENDPRHYLFREYLAVLDRLRPAAFVMENVRGMLSSTVKSRFVFEMLMEELASLGSGTRNIYQLYAIQVDGTTASLQRPKEARDFIVCAEDFGVPQRRHRVIIIGIRSDLASGASVARITLPCEKNTVKTAIGDLPPLRSGLSREHDDPDRWRDIVIGAAKSLSTLPRHESFQRAFATVAEKLRSNAPTQRKSTTLPPRYGRGDGDLLQWLERPQLQALAQHETRAHMDSDLGRYLFASVYGQVCKDSPKASDFPAELEPRHLNWASGAFSDRFRVQIAGEPSTTVTSHISKDGHYYIHHDPLQCRSLTVREAARLQTFPDDYLFLGNRTQQYVQVGNAVPPLLARQIAKLVYLALSGRSSKPGKAGADTTNQATASQQLTMTYQ